MVDDGPLGLLVFATILAFIGILAFSIRLFFVRSESMVFPRFDLFPQFASIDNVAVCIVDSSTHLGSRNLKREASLSSV